MPVNIFFRDISPLMFLYRVTGGIPIADNFDKKTKKYSVQAKVSSPWILYSFLLVGLQYFVLTDLALRAFKVKIII